MTSVGLVYLFYYIAFKYLMRMPLSLFYFILFHNNMIQVFDSIFFWSMWVYTRPSYLGKFVLISIWLRMLLTQMIIRVYKDPLTLTYSLNINIWMLLQFWNPWIGSLKPLYYVFTCTGPILDITLQHVIMHFCLYWSTIFTFSFLI